MSWRIPRLRSTDVIADKGVVSFYFQRWLDTLCGRFDNEVRTVTASSNVLGTDYLILADATAGAVTIALPKAADSLGRILTVKKLDASVNAVTLDGDGTETIDNAATVAITTQYGSVRLLCDGLAWWRI